MNISKIIRERATKNPKIIVLPEGEEPRMVKATETIVKEGFAKIILLGKSEKIYEIANELKVQLPDSVETIDPEHAEKLSQYADTYFELRKHKG